MGNFEDELTAEKSQSRLEEITQCLSNLLNARMSSARKWAIEKMYEHSKYVEHLIIAAGLRIEALEKERDNLKDTITRVQNALELDT